MKCLMPKWSVDDITVDEMLFCEMEVDIEIGQGWFKYFYLNVQFKVLLALKMTALFEWYFKIKFLNLNRSRG